MCCLCDQAEKLVAKLDALGATAGDLGLSLFKVAKFEVCALHTLPVVPVTAHVAAACVLLSRVYHSCLHVGLRLRQVLHQGLCVVDNQRPCVKARVQGLACVQHCGGHGTCI